MLPSHPQEPPKKPFCYGGWIHPINHPVYLNICCIHIPYNLVKKNTSTSVF